MRRRSRYERVESLLTTGLSSMQILTQTAVGGSLARPSLDITTSGLGPSPLRTRLLHQRIGRSEASSFGTERDYIRERVPIRRAAGPAARRVRRVTEWRSAGRKATTAARRRKSA